jgi:hypothetical protein
VMLYLGRHRRGRVSDLCAIEVEVHVGTIVYVAGLKADAQRTGTEAARIVKLPATAMMERVACR